MKVVRGLDNINAKKMTFDNILIVCHINVLNVNRMLVIIS